MTYIPTQEQDLEANTLKREHKHLSIQINTQITLAGVSAKGVQLMRQRSKDNIMHTLSRVKSITKAREELYRPSTESMYYNAGEIADVIAVENFHKVGRPLMDYIISMMHRQEAIHELLENYVFIDMWDMDCDKAKVMASRAYRHRVTNIGYRNSVEFVVGTPGNLTITEEPKGKDYNGNPTVAFHAKFEVDGTWEAKVKDNHLTSNVDIAGKDVFVLDATPILGHELEDQDVKLFQVMCAITKVPLSIGSYYTQAGDGAKICYTEARVVAIQELPDGKRQFATGKDQSWAIRTMKMRMKATMLRMMGVK